MTAQAKIPPAQDGSAQQLAQTASAQAAMGGMPIIDLFNATQALVGAGQAQAAIALYRLWLDKTVSPLAYAVCFNLAVTLGNEQDDDGAEQQYRQAIALNPQFVEPRLNLGTLLERRGRPDEALATWRAILDTLRPDTAPNRALYLQTLNNLGRLLEIQKQFPAAEEMLADSLRVDPGQPKVMTHWVHLRQKQCKWPVYSGLDHISLETMMAGTSALAMLSASDDPAQQLAAARRFVADSVNSKVAPLTGAHGYAHARLRVGYLSSDFVSHAVSILTAELYELHDRATVEVYGFCWSREDGSPLRARVVGAMDHHVRIGQMSDEEAARCIRAHEIDILIDLHGLTLGARPNILAYRPAPVQLTYLGFPGTTALPGIDYVIADPFVLPPEGAAFFTEQPLYLPDTFQINDRQRLIGARPSRASCSLPEHAFVFCSFNNNFKFTPEMFAVWMRILLRAPDSVLWLVADNELVRENLWQSAERAGVARARLIFAKRAVPTEYLARYQLADLFLDTYPFNAGTTASDALWAGLPLLTCAGAAFASRMAGSLLRAVDLPQLITYSFADYEERAVALAADRGAIAAMKHQLEENRLSCALFDSPRFVRNLEAALRRVAKAPAPAEAAPAAALPHLTPVPPTPAQAAPAAAPEPNPDLLALTPAGARKVFEIGCGDGGFAHAYRQRNPAAQYAGIERDGAAAALARAHCDVVLHADVEADTGWLAQAGGADCWILDGVLEQLDDPWAVLRQVRAAIAPDGRVLAAIKNFQHWRTQARLSVGDLRYQDGGIPARADRRVFTRGTILDLFQQAGFKVSGGIQRIADEPGRAAFLPAIRMMAQASGNDPDVAVQDALAWQYIVMAEPL